MTPKNIPRRMMNLLVTFRRPEEVSEDVKNKHDEKQNDVKEDSKKNDELTGD